MPKDLDDVDFSLPPSKPKEFGAIWTGPCPDCRAKIKQASLIAGKVTCPSCKRSVKV